MTTNTNEAIETINLICEKIGIGINSIEDFIPEFAKYNILHFTMTGIIFLIIFIIGIFIIRKLIKMYKDKDEWERDDLTTSLYLLTPASLIMGSISIYNFFIAIEWTAMPKVMAIKKIIELLN